MADVIARLNSQFGIPGVAEVANGQGGLPRVRVTCETALGEIYLHGAHITSWSPRSTTDVLFLSKSSRWEAGRAIRGGVPVCFPWFADRASDPKSPAHGFVRTKAWQLQSISQVGDAVAVSMSTESDADTQKWWPADFRLSLRATFGESLTLELSVENAGRSAISFEEALHSYYAVGDVKQIELSGLEAVRYEDKVDHKQNKTQRGAVRICSETDRVYQNTMHPITLRDSAIRRNILVQKGNSQTTVIWNPWIEKAKAMSDFGDDEWQQMVCIECANVGGNSITLEPGQRHTMTATISVEPYK